MRCLKHSWRGWLPGRLVWWYPRGLQCTAMGTALLQALQGTGEIFSVKSDCVVSRVLCCCLGLRFFDSCCSCASLFGSWVLRQ